MKKTRQSILDEQHYPKVVDVIPAGALAELGIQHSVPVIDVHRPADQRKWCVAVHEWLEHEQVPSRD